MDMISTIVVLLSLLTMTVQKQDFRTPLAMPSWDQVFFKLKYLPRFDWGEVMAGVRYNFSQLGLGVAQ